MLSNQRAGDVGGLDSMKNRVTVFVAPRLFLRIFSSLGIILCFLSCSSLNSLSVPKIENFNDCVHAGFPVLKTYPAECATDDGRIFVQGRDAAIEKLGETEGEVSDKSCVDKCGNGSCEQIVCQEVGCPCAENPINCRKDCGSQL